MKNRYNYRKSEVKQIEYFHGEFLSNLFIINENDGGRTTVTNVQYLSSINI